MTSESIICIYLNPVDVEAAVSHGNKKVPLPRVPQGKYFILLKGGKYGT